MRRSGFVLCLVIVLSILFNSGLGQMGIAFGAPKQEYQTYIQSDPRDVSPITNVDGNGATVLVNCFEPLVNLDIEGHPTPGLAYKWNESADQKTFTFYLRDAVWSDGSAITAEDVLFTWITVLTPETGAAFANKLFVIKNALAFFTGEITDPGELGFKALDEKTIVVEMENPTPYFYSLLNNQVYRPVSKKFYQSVGEEFGQTPDSMIYSGPFLLSKWSHEQEVVLEKNEKYWDASEVKLDRIVYHIIEDENLPLTMYETGELDSIMLDTAFLDRYRNSPELTQKLINNLTYISFNCENEYMGNKKLRQALSMTIDRDSYTQEILRNGAKSLRGFVPYGFLGASSDEDFRSGNGDLLEDISGDFEEIGARAAVLFAEGLDELGKSAEDFSKDISLLTWDPEGKKLAQVVQQSWKKYLGVDLRIEPLTLMVVIDRMLSANYSLLIMGYGSAYIDPMSYLEMYVSTAPQTSFWFNNEYDELIAKASSAAGDERMSYLYAAERLLMEELPIAPVYNRAHNYLTKPHVKNLIYSSFYSTDLSKVYIEY